MTESLATGSYTCGSMLHSRSGTRYAWKTGTGNVRGKLSWVGGREREERKRGPGTMAAGPMARCYQPSSQRVGGKTRFSSAIFGGQLEGHKTCAIVGSPFGGGCCDSQL